MFLAAGSITIPPAIGRFWRGPKNHWALRCWDPPQLRLELRPARSPPSCRPPTTSRGYGGSALGRATLEPSILGLPGSIMGGWLALPSIMMYGDWAKRDEPGTRGRRVRQRD